MYDLETVELCDFEPSVSLFRQSTWTRGSASLRAVPWERACRNPEDAAGSRIGCRASVSNDSAQVSEIPCEMNF